MKMKGLLRKILVMGIVALFLGAVGLAFFKVNVNVDAVGTTIYVDDDNVSGPWDGTVSHPYQNITSGLEHASDGDTIFVLNGMYNESVVVNKSVTLKGDSKPMIKGTSSWGTIFVNVTSNFAYGVTVAGFEILSKFYLVGYGINVDMSGIEDLNDQSVNIGDIVVANNTINSNATGISAYLGQIGYNMHGNSSVTIGDFLISNNTINSEGHGIEVEFTDLGSNMYNSSSFMMGGIFINDNILSNMGMHCWFSHWGYNLHQDSSFAIGNIEINGNTINNGDYGVEIGGLGEFGCELHDQSSFIMGHILVRDNTINSADDGIYVDCEYFGNHMDNMSFFAMGNIEFSGNVINSDNYGIDIYELYEFGYGMYGNSSMTMGSILVNSNNISSSMGIYVEYLGYFGEELYGNSSFTMSNIQFNSNNINSTSNGIYLAAWEYFGVYMEGTSFFTMGNIEFSSNVIKSDDYGIYIYGLYEFGYEMYSNSSFTMGSILINNNNVTSNNYGIYVDYLDYFGSYNYDASSFTMSNIELSGNAINSTQCGIYATGLAYEFGYAMNGDSCFTMGHILVSDNSIFSDDEGIYVQYIAYFGYDMNGNSSFAMGNIEFNRNEIVSGNNGIRIDQISYFGCAMYNNALFTMGSILFNDNTISSGWYGIVVYNMQQCGWEMRGNSSVLMNNIEFCRNIINSTIDALGIGNLGNFGNHMHDTSSFSMGSILVNDNTFYSYIWLTSFGTFGAYLYENSSCTMGNVEFGRNVVYGKEADGITFYNLQPFGYEMYNYALFRMGDFSVNSNVIASDGTHSGISCSEGSGGFGINIYNNAVAITGSFEFKGNDINSTWCGFALGRVKDAIIRNNSLWNSTYGIYLSESADNRIYHNNFINNTVQAYVTDNYNNTWDNGYPSGGNYWSNYNGTDEYKGPYQDIPGSDFIGDNWYIINANNTDHYPLWIPYETTPPTITILSPENTTYAVNASIPLTFTIDELTSWMGYSLNGQPEITITENTTLPILPDGWYTLSVFANDTFGNMGSATVYFTVDTTKPDITNVVQDPLINILPDTIVKVNATVTDATSGIKEVLLNCTFTNSTSTWYTLFTMTHLTGNIWNATIPQNPNGTNVTYVIIAEDNAGNTINTEQKYGYKYEYQVVPEFTLPTILIALVIAALLIALISRKKRAFPT
jgi:parallel beta-helix repeat protein